MNNFFRTVLVLTLAVSIGVAYTPLVAAKNNNSNSNSDDDKDKDKDKKDKGDKKDKKDDNQSSQSNKSKNSGSQQIQKFPQNNQFKYNKPDNNGQSQNGQSQKRPSNNQFPVEPQGQGNSKQLQLQGSLKQFNGQNLQNNLPQNLQKQNVQLQKIKDKPDWIEKSHHDHKDVKNYVVKFGGPEPFSAKWYKDHPHAWHHHHDHDDTWKVITAASVVGFLGWEAYHTHGPVIVYQPVSYDTLFIPRPGIVIDPSQGEWMPLGQFSLMLGPQDYSTRMLDLAVDRFGHIRGSYYDMVSGATRNVAGIVDGRTQYAQWALESNRQMTFYTPLGEMMQPQGLVYVQLPSGERQQWQLVRMDGGY